VGVGAVVQDGERLLVIKDRFSKGYKLPGGHIDPNETIESALVREVFEETGVVVEFESVINIGHFLTGQFGEQNIYFVCIAKNITTEVNIYDSSEIIDARWIDTSEFLNSNEVNAYNKEVVNAVVNNIHSKLTLNPTKIKARGEVFL
jgi:8-oxo-dGTP diphosphatase